MTECKHDYDIPHGSMCPRCGEASSVRESYSDDYDPMPFKEVGKRIVMSPETWAAHRKAMRKLILAGNELLKERIKLEMRCDVGPELHDFHQAIAEAERLLGEKDATDEAHA